MRRMTGLSMWPPAGGSNVWPKVRSRVFGKRQGHARPTYRFRSDGAGVLHSAFPGRAFCHFRSSSLAPWTVAHPQVR